MHWMDNVTDTGSMERITLSLNLSGGEFLHYWEKWIVFVASEGEK